VLGYLGPACSNHPTLAPRCGTVVHVEEKTSFFVAARPIVLQRAAAGADEPEDRIMSALDLNIGLMVLLEDLAKEHYDGNFTIMKLGPVWRIGFGTPLDREGMSAWAFGKTFAEAAKRAIAEALIEQRVSAAAVKEVAGTIDNLNATVHPFPKRRK
jgi:hypothetical protein